MSSTITLGDQDAAIIVRADGSYEAALPPQEGDEELTPASETIGMLMVALSDPVGRQMLHELFMKRVKA